LKPINEYTPLKKEVVLASHPNAKQLGSLALMAERREVAKTVAKRLDSNLILRKEFTRVTRRILLAE